MTDDENQTFLSPRQKAFLAAHPEVELVEGAPELHAGPRVLKGVGGWLGFLAASLIALGPMLSIVTTYAQHQDAEMLYPENLGNPLWSQLQMVDWVSVAAYCCISIFSGIRLVRYLVPITVPIVIFAIWAAGPGVAVITLLAVSNMVPEGISAADAGASLGRPLVYAMIWTVYLLRSQRVKNTYQSSGE